MVDHPYIYCHFPSIHMVHSFDHTEVQAYMSVVREPMYMWADRALTYWLVAQEQECLLVDLRDRLELGCMLVGLAIALRWVQE